MRTPALIILFIGILCCHISAQDIGAMKGQLALAKEDTTRCRLLNDIASYAYFNYGYDSCNKYSQMALQLAEKLLNSNEANTDKAYQLQCKKLKAKALENRGGAITYNDTKAATETLLAAVALWKETNDPPGMASAYLRVAEIYMNQNNYDNSLKYFDSSLHLYQTLNDETNIGVIYFETALTQRYMGNYGDALENNLRALEIARRAKDTASEMQCLFANGFIYMMVKDYNAALKVQGDVLTKAKAMNDPDLISQAYNDLGVTNMRAGNLDEALKDHVLALSIRKQNNLIQFMSSSYNYIALILEEQGRYKEALKNNFEGLVFALQIGDGRYIIDMYDNIANNYKSLKDYTNALKYYDTLLQASKKLNDVNNISIAMQGFAEVYMELNQPAKAIAWLKKAEINAKATDYRNLKAIYGSLTEVYSKTGDYKNAYESSRKYMRYNDSVASQEKALKLTSLTNQLEFENKQALLKASQDKQLAIKQSQIEKQKLVQKIFIAGLIIVIGLAVLFFIRFREKKRLNMTLERTLDNLKSTQAQLIQSEKMASLGELTAGIAHEIQNPLNFVNNFSELNKELVDELKSELTTGNLQQANEIADDIRENSEKINHHGKRADAIVKGMLQHSRKNSGQKEPTDINALCDEYLRLSFHGLRAKDKSFNADFKTDFDNSIGKINIVPQEIGRVILNLVNNAFYAVNEKKKVEDSAYVPTVTIVTKKLNSTIEIIVKDNGNGIPQIIVDKIFQPFFTTKPTGSGTGLGLSLSYDIIKAHGGEIKVNTKENEGSEFIIQLPIQIS
jgi:signal transduction histidine kinase